MAEYIDPDKIKSVIQTASAKYIGSSKRSAKDKLYSTLEDFTRTDPSTKRLVVIGCCGSGKSTLLNVLAGWRYVQSKETDYQFLWQKKKRTVGEGENALVEELDPLFQSAASSDSVTKKSSFANISYRGQADRELIVMDTPGHDDPAGNEIDSKEARDALGEMAADLHNKLKALGHVNTILVLHNDVISNRLNPATYQILKMVDEKFKKAGGSVWKHVVIGYSKCNAFETSWRSGLEGKKASLKKAIRDKIQACDVDVPVLTLGGGDIEPAPPSHDEADGLELLWEHLESSGPLDTSQLQPFEGADVKWQKLIDARDEAEQKAKAAVLYVAVMLKLGVLLWTLVFRHAMLPLPLQFLTLNAPGLLDESLIVAAFVYWLGPQDVLYSLTHFYKVWVEPKAQPYIELVIGPPKAKEE